jgi:hypothetical protein
LSRLDKAERPTTWREITFWFRDDGLVRHGHTSSPPVAPDWLAQRMSAVAREAGEPGATARWTLTYRRCAAPFEGDAALTNDEVKWSVVWIAILHGDFTRQLTSAEASPAPAGGYSWIYLLFDKDSHEVISEGTSAEPFDTSMFHLQGRTDLAGD